MPKTKTYLGLDIGGTKSAAIIGTSAGKISERIEWPSNAKLGQYSPEKDTGGKVFIAGACGP